MRIDIISAYQQLLDSPFNHSIIKRAQKKGLVDIVIHDLRDYGLGNYKQIDDSPFGGGAGMVLMIEPIANCIDQLKSERDYDEIIYVTPDAPTLNQKTVNTLSLEKNLLILTGHYKGVDQRIRDIYITKEISIGDYVLTNGALPAMVIIDAVTRLLPGVLGDDESSQDESFSEGLLEYPQYTRPAEFQGMKVPEVLLSGNHAAIEQWRQEQARLQTEQRRPDLLQDESLNES